VIGMTRTGETVSGPGPSQWRYACRLFASHRAAILSLVLLATILSAGLAAPWIAPHPFDSVDLTKAGLPPTLDEFHPLGTDALGRDYLSRMLFGIRTSAHVALLTAVLSVGLGTLVGSLSGYFMGRIDGLLMRITDLALTVPMLAVVMTAAAFLGGGSPFRITIILTLMFWPSTARIVRSEFMHLRESYYVQAARSIGASAASIMYRHMLPNAVGPIIVSGTLLAGTAILTESALSFLGFGVQPPTPALGDMVADGRDVATDMWWIPTFPSLAIVMIVLCVNFVGDGLRDALDPRDGGHHV
jgi:peptide/nickel transport system permease protein